MSDLFIVHLSHAPRLAVSLTASPRRAEVGAETLSARTQLLTGREMFNGFPQLPYTVFIQLTNNSEVLLPDT